jgi:hypothetical protein
VADTVIEAMMAIAEMMAAHAQQKQDS